MNTRLRPLLGAAFAIGCAAGTAVPPAYAGPAETAFLQSYVGQYTGRGQLTGGKTTEGVACRLSLQAGIERFRYTGRCTIAGESMPISGTINYSDQRGRYEASGSGMGTVAGAKKGNGVVFSMGRDYRYQGQQGTVEISFTLASGNAALDFAIADRDNGNLRAHVPLSR